jgi:hypothetical protein
MDEELKLRIEKLERTVDALCVTNFLTENEDGDEEVRNESVRHINARARHFKAKCKTYAEYGELHSQFLLLQAKIKLIAEDYPELKEDINKWI